MLLPEGSDVRIVPFVRVLAMLHSDSSVVRIVACRSRILHRPMVIFVCCTKNLSKVWSLSSTIGKNAILCCD